MRRWLMLLTVVALMMVMLALTIAPAFAAPPGGVCEKIAIRIELTGHGHLPPPCVRS